MLLLVMGLLGLLAGYLLVTNRHLWGTLALIGLFVCQGLVLLETQTHFGTVLQARTTTTKIAPITQIKGNSILVTETLKKGKTQYTAYATRQPKTQRTQLVLNRQKQVRVVRTATTNTAIKTSQVWRYHYQNPILKWWFAGITNDGQLQRQTVTYHLPKTWQVLTKGQLTQLGRQLKQKRTQRELRVTVSQQVAKQMRAHPQLMTQKTKLVQRAEYLAVQQLIMKMK